MNNTKERECDIQRECVNWFRNTYTDYLIFSVPNEGCYRRKNYFESLGMLSGVSDLIIVLPQKVIFVELKSKKGYQRPEQKDFQSKVESLQQSYYLCRTLEDFQSIIKVELT